MDRILEEKEYLAGDYSIADMASFPWVTAYKRYEVNLDIFTNVRRWFDAIKVRPAVRRGMDAGKEARNFGEGISKDALKTMFKQDAKSIAEMAKKKEED
jgi:GST-like protein